MTETESTKSRIKRRLNSYTDITRELHQIEHQLQQIEARITPGGQLLDGMPRAPGGGGDLSGIVAKRLDLLEQYRHKAEELTEAQQAIEHMIEGLEPQERTLARAKYIEGRTWEEVCVVMAYSWRQVHRIHARVLDKLAAAEKTKEETTKECD